MSESTDRFRWLGWIDRLNTALALIGGVAAVGLMLNVFLDVIGRTFLKSPIPPTLELTQYAWMPTLISFGLGFALLRGEHIRVSLMTGPTNQRTQRVIEIVSMSFAFATVAVLTYYTAIRAYDAQGIGEAAVGTSWLPIWVFRWIVVIGLFGLLLQALAQTVRACTVKEFFADDDNVEALIEQEESITHDFVTHHNEAPAQEVAPK